MVISDDFEIEWSSKLIPIPDSKKWIWNTWEELCIRLMEEFDKEENTDD